MSENKPNTVDSMLEKAKKGDDITLNSGQLREIAEQSQNVVNRAKQVLLTKNELSHLAKEIREETEGRNNETSEIEDVIEPLEDIAKQIDAHGATIPTKTSDFEPAPDPKKPQTFFDQVKGFFGNVSTSALGGLVRGWIGLQKTLISLGVMRGETKQLEAIEQLYGSFFGPSELREKATEWLKAKGVKVEKGLQDKAAYLQLRSEYSTYASTGTNGMNAEGQSAWREEHPFDAFIKTKCDAYAEKHPGAGRTTLTGIVKNLRPAESSDSK